MTKLFSLLALAVTVTVPTHTHADTGAVLPDAPQLEAEQTDFRGLAWVAEIASANGHFPGAYSDADPFNPYPNDAPLSRTRFTVFVTDEMTECYVAWYAMSCHFVTLPDLAPTGMRISNYTHTGAREVLVERIEYPGHIRATDGDPIIYVAVEG